MENAPRLYDTVFGLLGQHRHWRDVRHIKTLSWMVVGLLLSSKVSLTNWLDYVSCRAWFAQSVQRRILQKVNDYNREVFNGDLGRIHQIDTEEQRVSVQFDGDRLVEYDYADLNEITLAFACTIHKSQGSEYPVILPMYMQHYIMLSRNLLDQI